LAQVPQEKVNYIATVKNEDAVGETCNSTFEELSEWAKQQTGGAHVWK